MFKLATPWRDGTADIVMSQLNSLQRMAALRLRLWSNSVGRPLQGAESRRSGTRFGSTPADRCRDWPASNLTVGQHILKADYGVNPESTQTGHAEERIGSS